MINLFFIEKEKFICDMAELVLKEKGHQIYTVDSSEDCLYLIEDLTPNLVLIDLNSIVGNTEDFVSSIRKLGITLKIIALGSELTAGDLFDGFISKPLSPSDFEEQLTNLLEQCSA